MGGYGVHRSPVQAQGGRLASLINLFIHPINIQTFTELLLWVKDYSGHWDGRDSVCSAVIAGHLENVSNTSFYKWENWGQTQGTQGVNGLPKTYQQ